jgi:hypothetical protein
VRECTAKPLLVTCRYLVQRFNIDKNYNILPERLENFLEKLEGGYLANPYHNSTHAADVLCSTMFFVECSSILGFMSDIDILGLIIAAAGHDVGHPALTNRYLINKRDKLAIQFNDQSVLENMHCSMTFGFLQDASTDILSNFSVDDWMLVRRIIVEMILGTDMSKHFEMVGNFRARYLTTENDLSNFDEKLSVLKIGIKCADVGHAAKEIELHEKWSILVCEEFFH